MIKSLLTWFFIMAILIGFISCETKSVNPFKDNNNPIIDSLIIFPDDSVEVGYELAVHCYARDIEGDTLRYRWVITGGEFIGVVNESSANIRWVSSEVGRWVIKVEVFDIWHISSDSIVIWTLPRGTVNQPPIIRFLTVQPSRISMEDTLIATCEVIDDKTPSEDLVFLWTAQKGRFVENDQSIVRWIAPDTIGNVYIRVEVSDDKYKVIDSVLVTVAHPPVELFKSEFSTDEVTNRWSYSGLLAGLGQREGPHSISWDMNAKAMKVEGRSDYGTFAFKLNGGRFNDATYSVELYSTDVQFGCAGFIPVFVDTGNYFLISISYFQQCFRIQLRQNNSTRTLAEIWRSQDNYFVANEIYKLTFESRQGAGIVRLDDREMWRGDAPNFGGDATIGVAVYGLFDSGAIFFDNIYIFRD